MPPTLNPQGPWGRQRRGGDPGLEGSLEGPQEARLWVSLLTVRRGPAAPGLACSPFPEQPLPGRVRTSGQDRQMPLEGLNSATHMITAQCSGSSGHRVKEKSQPRFCGTNIRVILKICFGTACHLICRTDQTNRSPLPLVEDELSTRIASYFAFTLLLTGTQDSAQTQMPTQLR